MIYVYSHVLFVILLTTPTPQKNFKLEYICINERKKIKTIQSPHLSLSLFQSVSADLLNELRTFGDTASQQRARLEVSQSKLLLSATSYFRGDCFSLSPVLFLHTCRKSKQQWQTWPKHESLWCRKERTFVWRLLKSKKLSRKQKLSYCENVPLTLSLKAASTKENIQYYCLMCVLMSVWIKKNKDFIFPHVAHLSSYVSITCVLLERKLDDSSHSSHSWPFTTQL